MATHAYLFGAVCPATGETEALIAPYPATGTSQAMLGSVNPLGAGLAFQRLTRGSNARIRA